MTVALLYLAGVLLIFVALHFVRGRQSEMWRPNIPRQSASRGPRTHHTREESHPAQLMPYGTPGKDEKPVLSRSVDIQ